VWRNLGVAWRVSELSHKPYPAGRATHGGIEGILALRFGHPFGADEVEAVRITGPPLIERLCGRSDIPTPNPSYARLCMGFVGAKVLQHGTIDLAHYRGAELADPVTHDLARRITIEADRNPDPNAMVPQDVVVVLRNGRKLEWQCKDMLGGPARRLTREQHLAKFRRCLDFAAEPLTADAGAKLIELVDRLEQVGDVRELTEVLTR
jgi:aconitate decarboxylase